ncbi:winged helix-turn-helix transcriptional regulator [Yoonia sp. 2307UL14-13]|uniref:winged helix-turn-helix transcriptional regulator n=1 Tax=Yoonia sp. 2307UL14-13 TaxID=3126506 RepID=UPI003098FAD9
MRILSLLHRGVPARQAPLLAASGAGRTAFGQSLQHVRDLGLIETNPGHGHPLRPEYRLTPKGAEIAAIAARIDNSIQGSEQETLIRRAWTIPVLAVSEKPRYFGHIKGSLGRITDRALSQSIKQLEEKRWLIRRVDTNARPPRPLYQSANTGLLISRAVNG